MGYLRAARTDLRSQPDHPARVALSALHRLERRRWIKASWGTSDNNRRAKYYELTKRGRSHLEAEISAWRTLTDVVAQVLESV